MLYMRPLGLSGASNPAENTAHLFTFLRSPGFWASGPPSFQSTCMAPLELSGGNEVVTPRPRQGPGFRGGGGGIGHSRVVRGWQKPGDGRGSGTNSDKRPHRMGDVDGIVRSSEDCFPTFRSRGGLHVKMCLPECLEGQNRTDLCVSFLLLVAMDGLQPTCDGLHLVVFCCS